MKASGCRVGIARTDETITGSLRCLKLTHYWSTDHGIFPTGIRQPRCRRDRALELADLGQGIQARRNPWQAEDKARPPTSAALPRVTLQSLIPEPSANWSPSAPGHSDPVPDVQLSRYACYLIDAERRSRQAWSHSPTCQTLLRDADPAAGTRRRRQFRQAWRGSTSVWPSATNWLTITNTSAAAARMRGSGYPDGTAKFTIITTASGSGASRLKPFNSRKRAAMARAALVLPSMKG